MARKSLAPQKPSVAVDGPTPEEVVTRFLRALEAQDHDTVAALLAPGLRYTNVSLPTITGGERVARIMKTGLRNGTGFAVQIHRIATNGDIVMTERTDVIKAGPLEMGFWVCGTFRVEGGRITMWRDYFDWANFARGALRGVAGIALPGLRPKLPVDIDG